MNLSGVWEVKENHPFLVFFKDNDVKKSFMSEYDSEKGFGIFQTSRNYKVYTNTYVYNATLFKTSEDELIGINILKCFAMNQSQTLEAAVKRVQVVGLPVNYFCMKGERTPRITVNGASDLIEYVGIESTAGRKIADNNNEKQINFIEEHEAIIDQKREYEEEHLFSVGYKDFEELLQNIQDGIVYKFNISEQDAELYEEKFKENTGVEITANDQGRPVMGTIVELVDCELYIKFHDVTNSYDRIAKSGEIKERCNPEFAFKRDALELLKKDLSPNKYLLSILVNHVVKPFGIKRRYYPYKIIEKDGSEHDNVNPSQKDAIEKALNVEDFLLVQGPPGTGKTTIITEMIKDFVEQGLRVLICSKNNLAVDNVLEKCQSLYYDKEKTKKMQCLRLGNEEKVLNTVRGVLPRPLTLKIQDDVKLQSNEARTEYLKQEQELLELYEKAVEDTETICFLMKYFLREKEIFQSLFIKFQSSMWKILLRKVHRESFHVELISLLGKIDDLIVQLFALLKIENIQMQKGALQQYLKMTHDTYDAMETLNQELEHFSTRYRIILGDEKEIILNVIRENNEKKDNILRQMCKVGKYKGNPVAAEFQKVKLPERPTAEFVDTLQKEMQEKIRKAKSKRFLLKQVLDEWHEELENDQSSLEEPLLRTVKIIGATCIGVQTKSNFKNIEYDVAIVDEAGQITLHDLLVPLVKAKKVILIGDHLQLPPSAESEFCKYVQDNNLLDFKELDDKEERKEYEEELEEVFSVSLFEKLFRDSRLDDHKVMLDTQFRMHPDIAEFISANFYDGKYKSGISSEKRTLKIAGFSRPLYFIDTCNAKEKYEDKIPDPTVHVNRYEAVICASYLTKLIVAIDNNDYEMEEKKLKNEDGEYNIGVITAYKKQISYIRQELSKRLQKFYEPERAHDIVSRLAINTLDSFQGRDDQIIFYSFVRSNQEHKIGFLNEVRRLNVMMTRAKSLLVMIGDSETLTESKSKTVHDRSRKAAEYYKSLVDYCKEKHGYIDYANEV